MAWRESHRVPGTERLRTPHSIHWAVLATCEPRRASPPFLRIRTTPAGRTGHLDGRSEARINPRVVLKRRRRRRHGLVNAGVRAIGAHDNELVNDDGRALLRYARTVADDHSSSAVHDGPVTSYDEVTVAGTSVLVAHYVVTVRSISVLAIESEGTPYAGDLSRGSDADVEGEGTGTY